MEKITSVKTYKSKKTEKDMVLLNDNIHLSLKQIANAGYKSPLALYDENIEFTFYKKGDKMWNNELCTQDDTLVATFSIVPSAEAIRFAKAANAGVTVAF